MKRAFSKLILFILIFSMCILTASAENYVSKYAEILTGDWKQIGYWKVPKAETLETFYSITSFTYPFTPADYESGFMELVGNDDGSVYLLMALVNKNSGVERMALGEVMFSEDGSILLIDCGDYGRFMYIRQ